MSMTTNFMSQEAWDEHQEELRAFPTTVADADREYTRNVGAESPNSAWILSDRDVWYANPYYRGPKCIASIYPEDDDCADFLDLHAACREHGKCLHGFGAPVFGPVYVPPTTVTDDEIPF